MIFAIFLSVLFGLAEAFFLKRLITAAFNGKTKSAFIYLFAKILTYTAAALLLFFFGRSYIIAEAVSYGVSFFAGTAVLAFLPAKK